MQQQPGKRVYVADPTTPGFAVPTNKVMTESGTTYVAPIPAGLRAQSVERLLANGNPIMAQNGASVMGGGRQGASNTANTTATNQMGSQSTVTREFQSGASGISYAYVISYENNSGAAVNAVLGDANTIVVESQNISPLPGTVVVGGTWGANSDKIWRLVTGFTPVRVTGVRINFDITSYLTSGTLTAYKTRPDAIDSTDSLQIATWISPTQFQTLIIEPPQPFEVVWDASFALVAGIPDGRTVTFTFYYTSVGDVSLQRQISAPRQY